MNNSNQAVYLPSILFEMAGYLAVCLALSLLKVNFGDQETITSLREKSNSTKLINGANILAALALSILSFNDEQLAALPFRTPLVNLATFLTSDFHFILFVLGFCLLNSCPLDNESEKGWSFQIRFLTTFSVTTVCLLHLLENDDTFVPSRIFVPFTYSLITSLIAKCISDTTTLTTLVLAALTALSMIFARHCFRKDKEATKNRTVGANWNKPAMGFSVIACWIGILTIYQSVYPESFSYSLDLIVEEVIIPLADGAAVLFSCIKEQMSATTLESMSMMLITDAHICIFSLVSIIPCFFETDEEDFSWKMLIYETLLITSVSVTIYTGMFLMKLDAAALSSHYLAATSLSLLATLIIHCINDVNTNTSLTLATFFVIAVLLTRYCYSKHENASRNNTGRVWCTLTCGSGIIAYSIGILTFSQCYHPELYVNAIDCLHSYLYEPFINYILVPFAIQIHYPICSFVLWYVMCPALIAIGFALLMDIIAIAFMTIILLFTKTEVCSASEETKKNNAALLVLIDEMIASPAQHQLQGAEWLRAIDMSDLEQETNKLASYLYSSNSTLVDESDILLSLEDSMTEKAFQFDGEELDQDTADEAMLVTRMMNQFEGGMFMM